MSLKKAYICIKTEIPSENVIHKDSIGFDKTKSIEYKNENLALWLANEPNRLLNTADKRLKMSVGIEITNWLQAQVNFLKESFIGGIPEIWQAYIVLNGLRKEFLIDTATMKYITATWKI